MKLTIYLYDFIPVRVVSTQEPTFLYGLEPVGIGTPLVESLSSYLVRLASAHMLPVSALLRHVVADYLPKANHNLEKYIGRHTIIKNINGMGPTSDLVNVLEELTGRTALADLTMLPFSRLISAYRLMSSISSWCPYCLEERKVMEQPVYFPLLWRLREFKKCPIHNRYLRSVCPHCNAVSLVIASRTVLGYCNRCNGWLGSKFEEQPRAAYSGNYEFFVRLFEWQYTVGRKREQSTFPSLLQYLMGNKLKRNSVKALANQLYIRDSMLHELLSGERLPALDVVFRISKIFKIDPMDILTTSGKDMLHRDAVTLVNMDYSLNII